MEPHEYAQVVTAVLVVCINAPLLYVLAADKTLRSVLFLWVVGLVTVDISTGLLAIPIGFVVSADFDALSGAMIPACLFLNGLRMLTKHVALLGLLFITLDRFIAIKCPFYYNAHMSSRKVVVAIGLAWAMGFVVVELPLVGWNNGWGPDSRCSSRDIFGKVIALKYRLYVKMAMFMFLPMLVITILYFNLWLIVRKHARQIRDQSQNPTTQNVQRQEIQAAKKFALYSFVFVVCLFPIEVMGSVELVVNLRPKPWYPVWTVVKHVAVNLSYWISIFNPLLYVATNRKLRVSLVKYFPFLRVILRHREANETGSGSQQNGTGTGNATHTVTVNTVQPMQGTVTRADNLGQGSQNLGHSSEIQPFQAQAQINGKLGGGKEVHPKWHRVDMDNSMIANPNTITDAPMAFSHRLQSKSPVELSSYRKSSVSDNDVDICDFEAADPKQFETMQIAIMDLDADSDIPIHPGGHKIRMH